MSKKKENTHTYIVITPDDGIKEITGSGTLESVLTDNFSVIDFDPVEEFLVFDVKDGRTFHTTKPEFVEDK